MQAIKDGAALVPPTSPKSPSPALREFRSLVERFSSGAETAKAALDAYCPDPFKAILKPLVDVLAFLAKNYLQMVANRAAATTLGLSCVSAAHSIRDLLLGDRDSISSATQHPAVERFADLVVEAHAYIVKTLSPPETQQKQLIARMTALMTVNSVKSKLQDYDREINQQILQVGLAVNVSAHNLLVALKKQNEEIYIQQSRIYVDERVARLTANRSSIRNISNPDDDTTPDLKVDKVASIAITANLAQKQLLNDIALNNVGLNDEQVSKIKATVSSTLLEVQSVVTQLDGTLNIAEWMISMESVSFRDSDDTLLGQGSSGKVFLGKMDGKSVAVKHFKLTGASSLTVEDNIEKEIEAWHQISDHPNIVTLFGVCTKVQYFIVSEYCENRSAREYLQKLSAQGHGDEWSTALISILAESADGLSYLHSKNLIHRDVKGANVFVRKDGSAAIGDFGLSRTVGRISSMSNFKGTWNWSSPEQLTIRARELTAKTDTWSYGMMVFELLTNSDPYGEYEDTLEVQKAITSMELPSPLDVHENLIFLVWLYADCCRKKPADRISDSEIADRFADAYLLAAKNALTAGALFEDEESRQLPGKELARKQIAEIDKLDKLIYGLESLVSMHKLSKGRDVQVAIANFSTDADKNIQSTEELKEEVHRLRKQNEEMDIVIAKKNEKLELLESGKGAVNNMLAPGASFEDSPQYQEMSRLLSQQRQTLEDRDSLVRALKTQIQELRSQEHQLELNEFEHLKQLAAAGIIISKQSSLTSESMAARVRELESALDGERRLREFEQTKDADTIATLQSELTVLKVELEIVNRIFTTRYGG